MKKTILKLSMVFALAVAAVGLISCSDNDDGADFTTDYFTVERGDWEWNAIYSRYEFVFPYNKIDNYIYNRGTVVAGVYVRENGVNNQGNATSYTVMKPMPFVQSYDEGEGTYTETISFDYLPGYIAFYIQASDLSDTTEFLATYDFKVTLFWER